jgi:hypothetical protein
MKHIKLFEEFDEDMETPVNFPEPIKLRGKIYKNSQELQKDFQVSITNFDDEIEIDGQPYKDWAVSIASDTGEEEYGGDEGMLDN